MTLKRLNSVIVAALLLLNAAHAGAEPAPVAVAPVPTKPSPDADWVVLRVGGDAAATAVWNERAQEWKAGSSTIDTALPVGYPAPTPPGAIELKKYPSVRRAEINTGRGGDGGFWPLFKHIEREGIPMTSPVERDFAEAGAQGSQTMSFLYRTTDARETGTDPKDPRVVIRDTAAVTVLSIGGRGSYDDDRIRKDAAVLYEWLETNGEWAPAGPTRALLYNGPTIFPGRKWLEVQIPVKRVEKASPALAGKEKDSN